MEDDLDRRDSDAVGVPSDTAGLQMYKAAYEEGLRTIDGQVADLDSMRQRSLQFLAFVGSSTGFLVGSALAPAKGLTAPFWTSVLAAVTSGLTILLVSLTLVGLHFCSTPASRRSLPERIRGWYRWDFRLDPRVLVKQWIDDDLGGDSEREFYRSLALRYNDEADENARKLGRLRAWYYGAIVTGSLQLLLWVLVVFRTH